MSLALTCAQRVGGMLPSLSRHVVRSAHLPIWHAAISAEVQGSGHGGPGVGGQVGVQAGGQAEGQAGPAAQQDVGSREAQGAKDDKQEPTLGETAVMGCCGGGPWGLLKAHAGMPCSSLMGPNPSSEASRTSAESTANQGFLWAAPAQAPETSPITLPMF